MKKIEREHFSEITNKFNRYLAQENSWLCKQLSELTKSAKADFIKNFGRDDRQARC